MVALTDIFRATESCTCMGHTKTQGFPRNHSRNKSTVCKFELFYFYAYQEVNLHDRRSLCFQLKLIFRQLDKRIASTYLYSVLFFRLLYFVHNLCDKCF